MCPLAWKSLSVCHFGQLETGHAMSLIFFLLSIVFDQHQFVRSICWGQFNLTCDRKVYCTMTSLYSAGQCTGENSKKKASKRTKVPLMVLSVRHHQPARSKHSYLFWVCWMVVVDSLMAYLFLLSSWWFQSRQFVGRKRGIFGKHARLEEQVRSNHELISWGRHTTTGRIR